MGREFGSGDFNRDGVSDIAIGMPDGRITGGLRGELHVIFGTADPIGATLDLKCDHPRRRLLNSRRTSRK